MEGQELYQKIVSELRDNYLPNVGDWREHEEKQGLDGKTRKYFEMNYQDFFIGVTVLAPYETSQTNVRVALFPLSHYLPDGLSKKIVRKYDVFTEPCVVKDGDYGETFNRVCYFTEDAERPILAARDYLKFVMQEGYKELVDQYNDRVVELEDEMKKIEAEFAEKLEELVAGELK